MIEAFNDLFGPVIAADPVTPAGHWILFYTGDDADAKSGFRAVAKEFGFAPVDLGPLTMGRLMQVDGPADRSAPVREHVPHPVGLS